MAEDECQEPHIIEPWRQAPAGVGKRRQALAKTDAEGIEGWEGLVDGGSPFIVDDWGVITPGGGGTGVIEGAGGV